MADERKNITVVFGIVAGMLIGITAAIILYNEKTENGDTKLRDAKEIIDQCHQQIEEIERKIASSKKLAPV